MLFLYNVYFVFYVKFSDLVSIIYVCVYAVILRFMPCVCKPKHGYNFSSDI